MSINFSFAGGGGGGAVSGGLVYRGSYNATTSNPSLINAKKGDFYIVSVAGALAAVPLNVGDHIVFNTDSADPVLSSYFDVIDNTDAVASVNSKTGVVTLDTSDIAENTNLYYTNARSDARIAAADLKDLSDVTYTAGVGIDNHVLTYDHANTTWKAEAPATAPVTSVNSKTGVVALDTSDIAENTNLYYTNARADARIGAADLTDLNDVTYTAGADIDNYVLTYDHANTTWKAEAPATAPVTSVNSATGAVVLQTSDIAENTNLYYTNARADARIGAADLTDLNDVTYTAGADIDNYVLTYDHANTTWKAEAPATAPVTSVNSATGAVVLQTSDIAENTNLYYTNARADARIGAADLTDLNDVTYTAGADIDNYVLTYDHANTTWKAEAPATAPVTSVNSATGAVVLQTSDIAENTNLYYTNARADARIGAADLTDLNDVTYTAGADIDNYVLTYDHANTTWKAEAPATAPVTSVNSATGAVVLQTSDIAENTNLYYTNARADARIGAADLTDLNDVTYTAGADIDNYVLTYDHANTTWKAEAPATAPVTSVNSATGAVVLQTSDIAENTNLYYTNARADARIGAADLTDLNDVTYTAGVGIDNHVLTYDHANTTWKAEAPATAPVTSVNSKTGVVALDTSDIAENTNLYYTNARADARIGAADLTDLNDVTYTAGADIDNYVLTYDHANTTWKAEAPAGGGGSSYTYEAKVNTDSPVTAAIDYHYSCDTSSGAITINLPALSNANKGKEIRIKLKDDGNDLTLDGNSNETIDGSGTYILNVKNQSVTLVSDGSGNWEII